MSTHESSRLGYLDAVRGLALLLGIVFHACLSFMPIFIGWAVMDISTSYAVAIFSLISHSFRMELFFLIAGFFSHMKFHQQGEASFVKSRLFRLGIPFIIGWFILRPLIVSGWIMGAESMQGNVNVVSALSTGFEGFSELPKSLFVGTHLWFLYYLLLLSVSVVLVRYAINVNQTIKSNYTRIADRVVKWLCTSSWAILVIAMPTACCLWFMNNWGVDTPDKSLIPHLPVTFLYGGFFLFGWLLHRQSALIEQFAQLSYRKIIICFCAIIATVVLSGFEGQLAHPQYLAFKAAYAFCYALMMWSLVSITLGICKRLFSQPSKKMRYLADASYTLYLIHLPIVIWLQIAVAELHFHWSVKLLGVCSVTIVISLIIYDVLVRSTFIGQFLNGKKRSRVFHHRQLLKNKVATKVI